MIGNLRTRITIQIADTLQDDLGGVQTNWLHYARVWAHINPQAVSERLESGRLVVTRSYKVIIRWQRNFPERARLVFEDKILRVLSASDPDLRRERLHLICAEEEQ